MVNIGYGLSIKDAEELKKFKGSAAYGSYLKAISTSPAFKLIMKEHIDGIDVSEDIKTLKNQGKLPDGVNPKALSDLFKQSLGKMAICLVADSIILKELEDIKVEEVIKDLSNNAEITYLLGKADKKFYEQAYKLAEQGSIDENSVGYKGLTTYLKQSGKLESLKNHICKDSKTAPIIKTEEKKPSLEDDEITL